MQPAPELEPLKTPNLVERTVEAMRSQILSGKFAAGAELPSQSEMCDSLKVSRSVIREAMQILQAQGLIQVSQGRRPRVLPAGARAVAESLSTLVQRAKVSFLQLVEIRRPLEAEAAALAATRATPELIAKLTKAVDDLKDAKDIEAQIEADVRFHCLLAEATGNPMFGAILDVFGPLLHESRRQTLQQSGVVVAHGYHRRILKAVEKGDAETARREMLEHMQRTRKDIEGFHN
ncbi:MAG: FadR/GntR family transcriptional regulator [Gemmataceae bacterium]